MIIPATIIEEELAGDAVVITDIMEMRGDQHNQQNQTREYATLAKICHHGIKINYLSP